MSFFCATTTVSISPIRLSLNEDWRRPRLLHRYSMMAHKLHSTPLRRNRTSRTMRQYAGLLTLSEDLDSAVSCKRSNNSDTGINRFCIHRYQTISAVDNAEGTLEKTPFVACQTYLTSDGTRFAHAVACEALLRRGISIKPIRTRCHALVIVDKQP
jgi:hypothetical protein